MKKLFFCLFVHFKYRIIRKKPTFKMNIQKDESNQNYCSWLFFKKFNIGNKLTETETFLSFPFSFVVCKPVKYFTEQ